MKKAFTLMEILIFIALIALLATALLTSLNPFSQIQKAWDAKRKKDLEVLNKAFEDYYNDKGCYPLPEEVCYPGTIKNVCQGVGSSRTVRSKICYICGNEAPPEKFDNFKSYLSKIPCDPEHPKKNYLYEVEIKNCPASSGCQNSECGNQCPSWYRIYTRLSKLTDSDSIYTGCAGGGCGIAPTPAKTAEITPYQHSFGVSSPNISLEKTNAFYCCDTRNYCNVCGNDYVSCLSQKSCKKETINPYHNCLGTSCQQ
jgi:type II secretory pathway pseudopilin PulG